MPFKPVERQSVSGAVFAQVAAEIIGGDLAAGDVLPGERQLTEAFGVNRQAVREAVQRLDQLGLVEVRHGGATRVADYRRSAGLDLLPHLLLRPDGSLDATVIRSLMEMRLAVGPDIARLCATRATPAVIAELGAAVDDLAAAGTRLGLALFHDERFWDALVEGSDNVAYRLSLNALRVIYRPAEALVGQALASELIDVAGHRAVAQAVAAGRADAAERAARRLLSRGATAVATAMDAVGS